MAAICAHPKSLNDYSLGVTIQCRAGGTHQAPLPQRPLAWDLLAALGAGGRQCARALVIQLRSAAHLDLRLPSRRAQVKHAP